MTQIPMRDGLLLAGILFSLGLTSLLVRRNLIFILMSLEVMLNAAGLAFVVAGARWHQADGQVVFLFIVADSGAASREYTGARPVWLAFFAPSNSGGGGGIDRTLSIDHNSGGGE